MYGYELIIDLENADTTKFNRNDLDEFFDNLCEILEVDPQDRHYWDETNVPPHERLTDPKHIGTTAIQFLLKSNITIHTLSLLKAVYINIFVCGTFDKHQAIDFCKEFFDAKLSNCVVLERG